MNFKFGIFVFLIGSAAAAEQNLECATTNGQFRVSIAIQSATAGRLLTNAVQAPPLEISIQRGLSKMAYRQQNAVYQIEVQGDVTTHGTFQGFVTKWTGTTEDEQEGIICQAK